MSVFSVAVVVEWCPIAQGSEVAMVRSAGRRGSGDGCDSWNSRVGSACDLLISREGRGPPSAIHGAT